MQHYLIVHCVETGRDSVVVKTEADSNDRPITEYTHYDKQTTCVFYLSFAAFLCLRYLLIMCIVYK